MILSVAIIVLSLGFIISNYYISKQQVFTKVTGLANSGGVNIIIEGIGQTIPLQKGWNFISFYLQLPDYNLSKVFSSIDGDYEYVMEWNSSSQEFDVWSKLGKKDFTIINANKSYFIYMSQARNLSVGGSFFDNKTIVLLSGWEAPDYIYGYSSNITNNSFYGINFTYMQKWNVSSQEFIVYSHLTQTNPFNEVLASEGYFIKTEGGNLTYVQY